MFAPLPLQLGADFPVSLEAPHVVNMRKQVLATVMPSGPAGNLLQATYRINSSTEFQVRPDFVLPAYKL